MAQLVRAPERRAGDSGLNPGPGENFSLRRLGYISYSDLIKFMELMKH